jgi:succinylglutamate desuccinylase
MIKIFDSKKPGPNLVIMAGVHGDETCGLKAFDAILPTFKPLQGRVIFIIGSPRAVDVGRREFEGNLNRMFRSDPEITDVERNTYEYKRSRELMPILKKADALLDIHSSTTEQTIPFTICEKQSFEVVAQLPVEVVVSGIDALHPTGTDAFVNQSGGLGICIECGNHTDPNATNTAIEAISKFLSYFNVTNKKSSHPVNKQRFVNAEWIYKNKNRFTLSKDFQEFERIRKDAIIGLDGAEQIEAPYDGVILFPHNREESNTEAFLFGRENNLP